MTFRIGRKYAQHSYPTPRFGALAPLLQIGSDLLQSPFAITNNQAPDQVEKSGGTLLQVPLNGFNRLNGLWIEAMALMDVVGTGDASMSFITWFKFDSLPEIFIPDTPTLLGVGVGVDEVPSTPPTQPLDNITLTLGVLVLLPPQTSDETPIALPAVDNLQVGIAGAGGVDFQFIQTTSVVAGEIDASIITQIPTVGLVTLP